MFPLGRLRLLTTPAVIGSSPVKKIIGIELVANLAASIEEVPNVARMFTLRFTKSAADPGRFSGVSSLHRYSIRTFLLSVTPASSKPRRKGADRKGAVSRVVEV